ncbi:hypothetical protein MTO96_027828 [Rhipicephalus appendiculatus]
MEDYDWKPPSEAELKVLEARRERMDKISGIMGDYLLKGYKMLSEVCDVCSTILLEDRQRKAYCIACSEVDTMENVKDNPVLSDVAAQLISSNASMPMAPVAVESMSPCILASRDLGLCGSQQQMVENASMAPDSTQRDQEVVAAMQAVQGKMAWATRELKMCSSVELSIQMCNLIKTCAEAITALNDMRSGDTGPDHAARHGRCE